MGPPRAGWKEPRTFSTSVVMDRKHENRFRREVGDISRIAEDLKGQQGQHDNGCVSLTFHPSANIIAVSLFEFCYSKSGRF